MNKINYLKNYLLSNLVSLAMKIVLWSTCGIYYLIGRLYIHTNTFQIFKIESFCLVGISFSSSSRQVKYSYIQ